MNTELSFEFFPPRTPEGMGRLQGVASQLGQLSPEFFSVTFGAGGSTRDSTLEIVLTLQKAGHQVAPHISGSTMTREGVRATLEQYRAQGIRHLVVLRGDLPSGEVVSGDFKYAADLVAFIRQHYGNDMLIEVAAYPEVHPEASSAEADLLAFKHKVDAGANGAITQYFYAPEAYFHFLESCARIGVKVPIVPGIMPIYNFKQLKRFSDTCGAEIPRWICMRMQDYSEDSLAMQQFGVEVVTQLCERLLQGGAPGLHFYTLNQQHVILDICWRLGSLLPGSATGNP